MTLRSVAILLLFGLLGAGLWAGGVFAHRQELSKREQASGPVSALDADNPLSPLPRPPLGIDRSFDELSIPPTPETVRLGRWLFFDKRLSADGTISCATCHRPANGFSEPTPVSTGSRGQKGTRKAPPILNLAWTIFPNFFWDGRAGSLEEQALGPVTNPIEMGNSHEAMIATISGIKAYAPYFSQAFGDAAISKERIARAIADYERTRLSGNSPWDRWQAGDANAVNDQVKLGHQLFFFGKAACNQCHLGQNFTDSQFHNLGVGWDEQAKTFKDEGRSVVSRRTEDRGAFKTPTLREIASRAPYMHDGSHKTLREVVDFYSKGGQPNPHLSPKMKPLNLSSSEVDALVAFMEALSGEGYQDAGPTLFPQ
ncbi:cytochrome-c peroxidase [Humisphaera borealis]|uniref:C-type cytochrome n=1 Tax=Humisphaera borealis TaxID=2807512 RepID=A0A7M2WY56_9BACT|nr:cytochrome c peroxidase [Humisphaera borealis]QOV90406.1 c-type cytochrome [Humisphaera borealis]